MPGKHNYNKKQLTPYIWTETYAKLAQLSHDRNVKVRTLISDILDEHVKDLVLRPEYRDLIALEASINKKRRKGEKVELGHAYQAEDIIAKASIVRARNKGLE